MKLWSVCFLFVGDYLFNGSRGSLRPVVACADHCSIAVIVLGLLLSATY